jgi:hypothetical protein
VDGRRLTAWISSAITGVFGLLWAEALLHD